MTNDFNQHFSSVGSKINDKFTNINNFTGLKGQKCIHNFNIQHGDVSNVLKSLKSLSNTSSMDILDFDRKLLNPIQEFWGQIDPEAL